ncbi:oligoendopeptidase F [Pelosinus propionicus]|uniref:Oligopeptidase F n=1 Tax=Pelosinus propionicus DSM 13327 TaxID=1123291 RepID=A0A1I4GVC0_9FIRM|nr:oligoendopeptidase F [Pelosinus propionicus]SFL33287.1 oligoendopeptidase F [Pelosinus propionicus DSM 13327]
MFKMLRILPLPLTKMQYSNTRGDAAAGEASHVPSRSEIPDQYKWCLEDIYANDDLWQQDFNTLKSRLKEITQYTGTLKNSSQDLLACLKERDELGIISGKLYAFARMHKDENTSDTKYQGMTGKLESLLAEAGAATAFIEPEILALPDEILTTFRQQEEGLKEYNFYFDNLARQKKHVLSPKEEAILSKISDITQASENTFNMLAHADMEFPKTIDEQGQMVQLSEGRYSLFIRSKDRNVRQQAFVNLFTTYNRYRNTFASTLNGNVKQNVFYAKTRNYASTLDSALKGDNVPTDVYDNLIATVRKNLAPLQRYVALKKKFLQLTDIHMYDLYTPLAKEVKFPFPYEEGLKLVCTALKPLGSEYNQILDTGLTSGWIDVYENKGKQTGAYSWGNYGTHPFVLLNYNNRYDDVSTLAHEMGHAIHSYYSQENQPYATSAYTIFCAEVASTTNEILLLHHMLNTTTDKNIKLYLINQYLEQIRATIYRQTMFAEFEKNIYELSEEGETLTADCLATLWHDLNVTYYGSNIIVDKELDIEWARIPHFYSEFYVYQYVTGYSAATTLADKILTEGQSAQEKYINFLKSGSSDYSLNILKQAGVDMSSPKPIEITLNNFSAMLDQMEKLLTQ